MNTSGVVDGFLYSRATLLTRSTSVPLKPWRLSFAFGYCCSNSCLTLFHQVTDRSSASKTYVVEYATVIVPFMSSFRLVEVLLLPPQAATKKTVPASSAVRTPNR